MSDVVLCYHDVGDSGSRWCVTAAALQEQLCELMEQGYRFALPDDLLHPAEAGDKRAVITFDDGRSGCYEAARPLLARLGIKAVFYICTGYIDGTATEERPYSRFMTWQQVRELWQDGHVIGAHSLTHTHNMPPAEIAASMAVIRQRLGIPCAHFATPYGQYSKEIKDAALRAGCQTLMRTECPCTRFDPLGIPRIVVTSPCSLEQFRDKLITKPVFSFIIPARNEGPALQITVEGMRQLCPTAEIIVIDDASDTPVSGLDAVIIRLDTRQGIAKARNAGAAAATGDVLVFADAHVTYSANFVDELLRRGVATGGGIAGCATAPVDTLEELRSQPDVPRYYGWRLQEDLRTVPNTGEAPQTPFPVPYVGTCALAISRELFTRLGGFDAFLEGMGSGADLALAMKCWAHGLTVQVAPAATCWHLTQERTEVMDTPWANLDLPRYPGSFINLAWTLYRYLPTKILARLYTDDVLRYLQQWECAQRTRSQMEQVLQGESLLDALLRDPFPRVPSIWDNVDLREKEQQALFTELLQETPPWDMSQGEALYKWPNSWFPAFDAYTLTAVVRRYKTQTAIEVGSGFSTAALLDAGVPRVVSVDVCHDRTHSVVGSHPALEVITASVDAVPLRRFTALRAGDVLFIDSSHCVQWGSDVAYLLTTVLPRLAAGVLVHFHDIFYPFPYPDGWRDRGYNESIVVASLLANQGGRPRYRVLAFNSFIGATCPQVMHPSFLGNTGGSLWLAVEDAG